MSNIAQARKQLGATLADLRKAAGLSQPQLAGKLGYNGQFISNIERGVCYPPKHQLRKYAEALGIKFERVKALYVEAKASEIS